MDVTVAFNFSYFVFHERKTLVEYFSRARASLGDEGLFVIDRQFRRWKLTPAEAEVAMLLLKGLSHKETAGVRGTSERTVREQARSLYKKGGLAGRSELSAFFLEDLLVPQK